VRSNVLKSRANVGYGSESTRLASELKDKDQQLRDLEHEVETLKKLDRDLDKAIEKTENQLFSEQAENDGLETTIIEIKNEI
jgi:peptidoglycan hydrolase CwlO-like protein